MTKNNWPTDSIKKLSIDNVIPYANNARTHSEAQIAQIAASIKEWGWTIPVLIDEDNTVLAGHGRIEAARQLGITEIPVIKAEGWSDAKKKAYVIADNKLAENAGWDETLLALEIDDLKTLDFDLPLLGFNPDELEGFTEEKQLNKDDYYPDENPGVLTREFMIPPFSVFDTRQGYWQNRKRYWKGKGINSVAGREEGLIGFSKHIHLAGTTETSEFDPVLAEILYRWFSPPGGTVLDPFAGGSVRGLIAGYTGRVYVGVDLREEQVTANREQLSDDLEIEPIWICGNSLTIDKLCKDIAADFLMSCPPYHDLEKYSVDPADLSNQDYETFIGQYREIIKKSADLLKDNRFACFTVSEIRDKKGNYKGFVKDTIAAFEDAGLSHYNEAILLNTAGSLGLRSKQPFLKSRKLGRQHQNVLIFIKGDPAKAAEVLGVVDVPDDYDPAEEYGDVYEPETDH